MHQTAELRRRVDDQDELLLALRAHNRELGAEWRVAMERSPPIVDAMRELAARAAEPGGADRAWVVATEQRGLAAAAAAEKAGLMQMLTTLSTSIESLQSAQARHLEQARTADEAAQAQAARLGRAVARARALEGERNAARRQVEELSLVADQNASALAELRAQLAAAVLTADARVGDAQSAERAAADARAELEAVRLALEGASASASASGTSTWAGWARAEALLARAARAADLEARLEAAVEQVHKAVQEREDADARRMRDAERAEDLERRLQRALRKPGVAGGGTGGGGGSAGGAGGAGSDAYLKQLRRMVICPIKPDNGFRNAVLTTCGHCFAKKP
jgi:hypothetical protein